MKTVQLPREWLWQLAFEILREMLKKEAAADEATLDTELAIRDSTAAAPLIAQPSSRKLARIAPRGDAAPEFPQFAADSGVWQAGGSW